MANPTWTTITSESTLTNINDNFTILQEQLNEQLLTLHYLDLYTLKGSVGINSSLILVAYNTLSSNQALLIVPDGDNEDPIYFYQVEYNVGDYLLKTPSGPIKVPGPETGLYKPTVDSDTKVLSFSYVTSQGVDPTPVNIKGDNGAGYDYDNEVVWSNMVTIDTQQTGTTIPMVFFFDATEGEENVRIDIPYTLTYNTSWVIHVDVTGDGRTLNIRMR